MSSQLRAVRGGIFGGGAGFAIWPAGVVAVLLIFTANARAAEDAALSAKALAWASANIGNYTKYIAYARQKARPDVPVPPMVDPPCHVCGDSAKTQGETEVDAWVKRSQEPEITYITGLLAMDKQLQLLGGLSSGDLSPAAQKALRQFEDDAGFMSDAGKLADRLYNGKAIPMAQRYDKEPKQAYAGIQFLLATARDAALIQGGSSGSDNQAIDLARTWTESIAEKIDKDVVSGHKYNLCPVYASIYRQVELLGGPATDMDAFTKTIEKLQDLLRFNVNLNLHVTIDGSDGSHTDATWTGKSRLKLKLDMANSCFTPEFEDGAKMAVNVQNFNMTGVVKHSDGSTEQVPVQLTSSHSYNVPLGKPQVNLCDPQPVFQFPVEAANFPREEITAKGHMSPTALFPSFLSAVIAANEVNSGATNAVTGASPKVNNSPPPSGSGSKTMDDAKAKIDAHKGDVGWLMGPEGQAAIAQIQKAALAMTQSKMASAGVAVPQASSFANLAASLQSAHLNWTNGQSEPVNQTLKVSKDGAVYLLTVTVDQSK